MLEPIFVNKMVPQPKVPLEPLAYQRYSIVSTLLFVSALAMLFFGLYNSLLMANYIEAWVSFSAATINFVLLWLLYRTLQTPRIAFYAMLAFGVFLLIFNGLNQNQSFGMMWNLFFPAYALLAIGGRLGLRLAVVFYVLLLIQSVYGLGIWPAEQWDVTSLVRLTVGYFILTYLISMSELANEISQQQTTAGFEKDLQYMEKLQVLSITDPLTGLFNRRHFMTESGRLVHEMDEQQASLVLFILDIDDFKLYNDTYGHQKGDDVLELVAAILKAHGGGDNSPMFRLGGEEFGGILLSKHPQKIIAVLEQLRADIMRQQIKHEHTDAGVLTVSIGVKVTQPQTFVTMDDVYKMADIALYRAKELGRNRVEVYDERLPNA